MTLNPRFACCLQSQSWLRDLIAIVTFTAWKGDLERGLRSYDQEWYLATPFSKKPRTLDHVVNSHEAPNRKHYYGELGSFYFVDLVKIFGYSAGTSYCSQASLKHGMAWHGMGMIAVTGKYFEGLPRIAGYRVPTTWRDSGNFLWRVDATGELDLSLRV